MGKGKFCWQDRLNEKVVLSDFTCKNTTFNVNRIRIWCSTQHTERISLLQVNKVFNTLYVEDKLLLETS